MEDSKPYQRLLFDQRNILSNSIPHPIQNQYSILNHPRNPYYMFDPLSFELNYQEKPVNVQNQSLTTEIKQWRHKQKQTEKENSFHKLQNKILQLSRIVKQQENSSSRNNHNFQLPQIPPINMSMPMMMPYMSMLNPYGMSGNQCHSNSYNNCCCHQNHGCSQNHRNHQNEFLILRESRAGQPQRYQPRIVQNRQAETHLPKISRQKRPKKQKVDEAIEQKEEVQPKAIIKVQQKKRTKGLLRRWRVCSIAIYFCIYFRQFSKQFTFNRYNDFKYKYLLDGGKELTNNYKEVYNQLLKLNIPELARQSAFKIKESRVASSHTDISSFLKPQNAQKLSKLKKFSILSQNRQVLFSRCGQFLSGLLVDVGRLLKDWQWGQIGYGMGIGCLNRSFLIDNIFLPHEIYLMKFHNSKGYMSIDAQSQQILLMTKLCVKILLFNVCLQLDNNKEWLQMFKEELQDRQDTSEVFILLEIASKILFVMCQGMFQTCTDGRLTNYDEVNTKFQVAPSNPLVYSHSIKKRRELFKNQDLKDSDLLIYGLQKLDEVNEVMNEPFFNVVEKKVQLKLNQLVQQTLLTIKEYNRKKYQQIWEETLNSQYIVLRGINNVMKSNKFYPLTSVSAMPSKNTVATTKKTFVSSIKTISQKSSITDISKKKVQPKSNIFKQRNGTKISIQNNLQQR